MNTSKTSNAIGSVLRQHRIPAAVIQHSTSGNLLLQECYGSIGSMRTEPDTIFDCASLTKPLVTTLLILQAVESGLLTLQHQLSRYNEAIPPMLHDLRLDDLLTHSSGIRSWFPLYTESETMRGYLGSIARMPRKPARKATIYSCLNFVVLAAVLEHIHDASLPILAQTQIFAPLGLQRSSLHQSLNIDETAPTEDGNRYEQELCQERGHKGPERKGVFRGIVHDGNAFYVGSRCGNAGLFSSAPELAVLADQFIPGRSKLLSASTLRILDRYDTPWGEQRRTLGWVWSHSPGTGAIPEFGSGSLGHNGFTGTSLWLTPSTGDIFIILTNRIHPEYRDYNMNRIRREIHRRILGME